MYPPLFQPTSTIHYSIDPLSRQVTYRVESPSGRLVAGGIESHLLARQIACIDELYDAFTFLLAQYDSHVSQCLYDMSHCWATLVELVHDDDGEYERAYPGIQERADRLVELYDLEDFIEKGGVQWR